MYFVFEILYTQNYVFDHFVLKLMTTIYYTTYMPCLGHES